MGPGREAQEGADIWIPLADSCCCTAETNTALCKAIIFQLKKKKLELTRKSVSRSVVSNSLCPPWTVSHQAPLSMGILQARILEWVAVPFSKGKAGAKKQNPSQVEEDT